ncbi:unnamed protein product, partial [Didymodactylos carnosus]
MSTSSSTTSSTINKGSHTTLCNQPIIHQLPTSTRSSSISTVRFQLDKTVNQHHRQELQIPNFPFDQMCPSSSSLQNKKDRARFSSVSASYSQFLKSRDIDKVKKILSQEDQRLLLSSEFFEDAKDSDPYVSVIARLGEAIQDSETLTEF